MQITVGGYFGQYYFGSAFFSLVFLVPNQRGQGGYSFGGN